MRHKILIILIILPFFVKAQNFSESMGIPFIKNFSTTDYNAHEQNFDIVQDSSGIMYFANFEAVLIYDGSEWKKVSTKSGMRVLSLAVDSKGKVYVGGLYDFGYIQKKSNGVYEFISLADSTMNFEQIGEIFDVEIVNDTKYFISSKRMFVCENGKIRIEEFQKDVTGAFVLNNELYLFFQRDIRNTTDLQNGLTVYRNNKFVKIIDKSSEQILDIKVSFKLPNSDYSVVGTQSQGFFKIQNDTITDLDAEVNKFVKKNSVTCGIGISQNLFAIGTLTQGLILVNLKGEIVQIINKESSLKDNSINSAFLDAVGNVWLGTNNGISLIELNSALSEISNESSGINGKISKIFEFQNKLFVATDYGLYYFEGSKVKKVPNLDDACWDILQIDNELWIATPQGVFIYRNGQVFSTPMVDFSFSIIRFYNKIFIGQNSSILALNYDGNNISIIDTVKGIEGNVINMLSDGNLIYCEVPSGKIYELNADNLSIKELKTGNEFISLHLNQYNKQIFFTSEKGLFYKTNKVDTLIPFNLIKDLPESANLWMYDLFFVKDSIYLTNNGSTKNISFLFLNKDKFRIDQTEFLPIDDIAIKTFFYSNTNNDILMGGNDGIVIFNFNARHDHQVKYKLFFTKIKELKTDSLLSLKNNEILKLKYSNNSLEFWYSAPYYPTKGNVYYRYFLQGFDDDTSEWAVTNFREFSNLPPGTYKIYVEAKDQFGQIVQGDSFDFKILVPLGRRWWMVIIYIALLVILIKFFIDWRIRVSEKEKEQLEEIIKERTEEIEKSKVEIEAQRDIEYAQRKEIMDSIHYAKRIQQAVLPSKELINSILGENHFVYFRPYEVVSGDFFWIKELKNFVAIIAADCTGHGVPGAFMSMLGTSFLNEIVNRRSLDSAAEVLERLRQKVKHSMHQEGKHNEQKDGMDIAMYFIDRESYELQFAGAYNSLYIVRHNDKVTDEIRNLAKESKKVKLYTDNRADPNYTLIELKADRQPIGIYIREMPFVNVSFKLQKGDTIYSFSDGYSDQFGGETGEKLNSKRFKSLFLSIQDKDMEEQQRILEQNFIKWKGDLDQVDDVLVFGVRVDF